MEELWFSFIYPKNKTQKLTQPHTLAKHFVGHSFFQVKKKKVDLEIIKCTFHSGILNDKKRSLQIC